MDVNKFRKYIRNNVTIKLTDESGNTDEFNMMPLTNEDLIDYMNVSSEISAKYDKAKKDKINLDQVFATVSKETWVKVLYLCGKSIKLAYPDIDPKIIDEFTANNFIKIFPKLHEVNSGVKISEADIQKKMDDLK